MEHQSLNRGSRLPLLFGIPFSIVIFSTVIFIVWTFSANKHMDGWIV